MLSVFRTLIAGGVKGIELPTRPPTAVTPLKGLPKWASTVLLLASVQFAPRPTTRCVDAGATYAVSPHFSQDILTAAQERACPFLPGCITPTEIVHAWEAGASCIKLFPGSLVGASYAKALQGPLPDIPLMPTGGVSLSNMAEWFAAGVVAVGMGGNLAKGEPADVTKAAEETMKVWKSINA